MSSYNLNNNSNNVNRNINYLSRDFSDFRSKLITFSQTYFPNTYSDFSPSSPAMVFIEMASYVGDVLSFYLDNQVQENFVQYARQSNNIYELAYMFGYTPRTTGVSTVDLDFFQQLPAKVDSSGGYVPDYNYVVTIPEGTVVSGGGQDFIIYDNIDFSISSSYDPTDISILTVDSFDNPEFYIMRKKRRAFSGNVRTETFTFTSPTEFATRTIEAENIIGILNIFDSNYNQYHEVDYLGQETIFKKIKNTNYNDPNLFQNSAAAPYILKVERVQRRFATRFLNENTLQLQFGSGIAEDSDEEIVPNQNNVGIGLPFGQDKITTAYSPQNFIFTNTYGIAPANTTLTVSYMVGGGVGSNVVARTLTTIDRSDIKFQNTNLSSQLSNYIRGSVAVTNMDPATGGQDGDTLQEIRQNISANYSSQLRAVTLDDYIIRVLSMPPEYGVIAKAYIEKPKLRDQQISTIETLSLYVLSYNNNKKLTYCGSSLKNNIRTYINEYKMIGDSLEIRDAFIINIGIEFDIVVLPNYNSNEVLKKCLQTLKDYFKIDNWQINQPILYRDLFVLLDKVDGVQTVNNVYCKNLVDPLGLTYSEYGYDIPGATIDRVIYPPLDPSIFEIKDPDSDIVGRVVNF